MSRVNNLPDAMMGVIVETFYLSILHQTCHCIVLCETVEYAEE